MTLRRMRTLIISFLIVIVTFSLPSGNSNTLIVQANSDLTNSTGNLNETIEVTELIPGVTHQEISRGYESHKVFYTVEMGFLEHHSDALELRNTLLHEGIKSSIHKIKDNAFRQADVGRKTTGYVVQVGEFDTQAEANSMIQELRNNGFSTSRVAYSEYDGTRKSTGPWNIHVLEINSELFEGSLQTGLANDKILDNERLSSMAERRGALAAINGGYFVIGSNDGTPGSPAGISVLAGKLVSESVGERTSFILEGNQGKIAETHTVLSMQAENGETHVIDGINRTPGLIRSCGGVGDSPSDSPMHDVTCTDEHEIIQFNDTFGERTPSGDGFEVILDEQDRVVYAKEGRGIDIPDTGRVLSAIGDGANWLKQNTLVGEKVILTNELLIDGVATSLHNEMNIVNGAPRLLKDGEIVIPADQEGFNWSSEFYYNFALYRHPRTLVGIKENGNMLFVTIDGRNPGTSIGMSFYESAQLLKDLGAVQGMNLDGGGSTTMVINNEIVNTPSGSAERAIADGIFIME